MRQSQSLKQKYKSRSASPKKQKPVLMQRRSKSKVSYKQSQPEILKSQFKSRPSSQHPIMKKHLQNSAQARLKQNIMISLTNIFMQSQNDPSLIHPWMKQFHQLQNRIIGTNYIVVGPAQSGKYSVVKYALGQFHKDLHQIFVNCDISTTENLFFKKIVEELKLKCRKWNYQPDQMTLNKLITPDNIDFSTLNPFIQKAKIKFVVVIKNAQHLVGFKKQTILYSLFEWMKTSSMQQRAGLVLITRDLRITDKFQKRIKSRFCGNRLCIFRPEKSEIYIKILAKRVQAVIKDKQVWIHSLLLQNPEMKDQREEIYHQSDDENNGPRKSKAQKPSKSKKDNITHLSKIFEKFENHPYLKSLNEYYLKLKAYLSTEQMNLFGIQDFFKQKMAQFDSIKNKKDELQLFSQQTVLTPSEQIECLKKIKSAVEQNKELSFYLESEIKDFIILPIPMILQKFQKIFLMLDETIIKNLSSQSLGRIFHRILRGGIQTQYTNDESQNDCLESLNNVELLILILILKSIDLLEYPIRLHRIYDDYKSILNIQIGCSQEISSNKIPIKIIQRSIDRLYRAKFISYDPRSIWNSSIDLIYDIQKIKQGLKQLSKKRRLTDILKKQLKNLNLVLHPTGGQVENIEVNITSRK